MPHANTDSPSGKRAGGSPVMADHDQVSVSRVVPDDRRLPDRLAVDW
jgi:hypothetical protein